MCDECYISSSPEDKYHKEVREVRRHKITKRFHCRDHPSLVHSGRVQWLLNGKYHREGNLPSHIAYHNNGKISVVNYEVNDAPHKMDGAAVQHFDESGNLTLEKFYIHGTYYPNPLDYWIEVERLKSLNPTI